MLAGRRVWLRQDTIAAAISMLPPLLPMTAAADTLPPRHYAGCHAAFHAADFSPSPLPLSIYTMIITLSSATLRCLPALRR